LNLNRWAIERAVIPASAMAILMTQSTVYAGNTWDGGAGTGNWSDGNNWNADGAPVYGTLVFSGNTQTTTNNNSVTAMNQVNWNGTAAWVMNGSSTLSLFDFGGTQAKLESLGSGGVTINANITFAANNGTPPNPFGEINAVSSNIAFTGGTLTVNGSSVNGIKFFGGAGRDVSFANTVSASGKWFGFTNSNGSSITIASGANVTTGDFYVMNGNTLNLSGGTLTTSAVRLGGDFGNTGNQNQTLGGTLALTPLTGGVNFSSVINTVINNSSNALLIDSKNTSGNNTLSGSLFLDSDLRTLQQAGGTLAFTTGSTDIKGRRLTVDGAGTTSISQVLSSSLGAGGMLVKAGAGTLILSNVSNTYTGTNNNTLNASGTQINAGTLAIAADTSLGLAPSGAYNNVQFTGSGTLRSNGDISLHANRNISVANGSTATFDSAGNTFTINGIINGSGGAVTKTGAGTVVLTATNSYTGATNVNEGRLIVTGAISNSSGVTVAAGARLAGESSDLGVTNGKVSAITLSGGTGTGGILSPGNGTAGDLGTLYGTSLAWNGSTTTPFSQMQFDLGSSNASDKLILSGAMTKGTGSIFEWDFGGTGVLNNIYTLVTATGGFGSGESAFIASNFTYKAGSLASGLTGSFSISGNNLNFAVIPEPTSALAGLLIGAGLLRRRRNVGC
jgi:autotransporter-associated beta strand protein